MSKRLDAALEAIDRALCERCAKEEPCEQHGLPTPSEPPA
jgi:hypothetical protein